MDSKGHVLWRGSGPARGPAKSPSLWPGLTQYEEDLLKEAKVEFQKNKAFFEQAKALLREPKFDELLADAKSDEKEGRKALKNPTARLIHRLMKAIESPQVRQKTGKIYNAL